MRNPNENDKELQNDDWITTYPQRSNISFIRYFDDKDIPNSIQELKKIYKTFTEND